MTWRWSDTLCEPLKSALAGLTPVRVERGRDGAWYAQEEGQGTIRWYRFTDDEPVPRNFSLLDDKYLSQCSSLLEGWLHDGWSVSLLAHKIGSRQVFGLVRDGERLIAKIYRKDRGVLERWHLFDSADDDRWSTPTVRSWDAENKLLLIEAVPGESLNKRWLGGREDSSDGDRVADLLAWMLQADVPEEATTHDVRAEARILHQRLPEFNAVLEDDIPGVVDCVARVVSALVEDTASQWVCGHRDLHDKQIFFANGRGSLIDLDLAARVPLCLDAGNIIAHLRLRALQRGAEDSKPLPWQQIAARIATPVLERGGADTLHRWVASTLMRLTLIYSRRRRNPELLETLLASTSDALDRCGEWKDVLR